MAQPFPYWELNDIDVSQTNNPARKLYFMVRVDGVDTATSIWAHGADPRTYFPQQDVPSGVATDDLDAVDARIEIVWPHRRRGQSALRGRRHPRQYRGRTLQTRHPPFGAGGLASRPGSCSTAPWDQEVSRALSRTPSGPHPSIRRDHLSGMGIPQRVVAHATDPTAKLYLWANVTGTTTYPTIWAHGADPAHSSRPKTNRSRAVFRKGVK